MKVDNKLFDYFAGEYLCVMIEKEVELTQQSGNSITSQKTPVTVLGYLVDEDDSYIYLGGKPDVINQCVKKDTIIHIQVTEEEEDDQLTEFLRDVEIPEGENNVN